MVVVIMEENSKEQLNQVEEKKVNEWDRMKQFIFTHKKYVLTILPIVLVAIFLGSMCSSFQKNEYNVPFILCLVGVAVLLVLSVLMVHKTKKQFIVNNISMNVLISIIFAYMFFSGLVLMIFYKILSMIDAKNILNITGLTSVIVIVVYILSIIASLYIDFDKIINFFKNKFKKKQ